MTLSKMIKRISGITVIAIGLFWMSGCLDEIDFVRPDAVENGIAIQGKLVKGDPSFVRVTIRKTFDFSEAARLINAREVTIINEEDVELELVSKADGIFTLEIPKDHPNFKVEFGNSFKLRVSTFDNRVFESSLENLFQVPKPEKLEAKRTQIEIVDVNGIEKLFDQITFTINSPLKPENSSDNAKVLWEMLTTHKLTDSPNAYSRFACFPTRIEEFSQTCYLSGAPSTNYIAVDGPQLNSDRVDNFELLSTGITPNYSEGFYLTVLQQSLSQSAYDYWAQVNLVVDRTGDIFQPPAGKVITNFTNINDPKDDIFGYFYVTDEEVIRVFVSPELAGNPAVICPSPTDMNGRADNDCCNCTSIGGANSTIKPSWWIN